MPWPARWFRTQDRNLLPGWQGGSAPSRQGLDLAGQLAPALQNGR